jgi:hypothetical protein
MAKLALINREEKRRKMVAQYAGKRAALESIINDASLSGPGALRRSSEASVSAAQFKRVSSTQSLPANWPSAWCFP